MIPERDTPHPKWGRSGWGARVNLLPRHAHVIANNAIGPVLVGVHTHLSDCLIVSNIINKSGAKRGQARRDLTVFI